MKIDEDFFPAIDGIVDSFGLKVQGQLSWVVENYEQRRAWDQLYRKPGKYYVNFFDKMFKDMSAGLKLAFEQTEKLIAMSFYVVGVPGGFEVKFTVLFKGVPDPEEYRALVMDTLTVSANSEIRGNNPESPIIFVLDSKGRGTFARSQVCFEMEDVTRLYNNIDRQLTFEGSLTKYAERIEKNYKDSV